MKLYMQKMSCLDIPATSQPQTTLLSRQRPPTTVSHRTRPAGRQRKGLL